MLRYGAVCIACVVAVLIALPGSEPRPPGRVPAPIELERERASAPNSELASRRTERQDARPRRESRGLRGHRGARSGAPRAAGHSAVVAAGSSRPATGTVPAPAVDGGARPNRPVARPAPRPVTPRPQPKPERRPAPATGTPVPVAAPPPPPVPVTPAQNHAPDDDDDDRAEDDDDDAGIELAAGEPPDDDD